MLKCAQMCLDVLKCAEEHAQIHSNELSRVQLRSDLVQPPWKHALFAYDQ